MEDDAPAVSLWLPKVLYIVATMAGAGWGRYQMIFLNEKGLSASFLGLMRGVGLLTKLFAYPAWGLVADLTGSLRTALIGTVLSSTLMLELFRFDWTYQSILRLLLVQTLRSASNSVWPLVDAFAISAVKSGNAKESYGHQRLWCAISWGLSSFVIGVLIDGTSLDSIFYFTYSVVVFELFLICYFMPTKTSAPLKKKPDGPPLPPLSLSLKTFFTFQFFTFFTILFTYGIVMSIPETTLILHMKSNLLMSSTEYGLSMACSVVLEIPLFYSSQHLLTKHGIFTIIFFAEGATLLRLIAYFFVTPEIKWTIHFIQLLHGVCFAGFWVSVVHLGQTISPKGLTSTTHTLVSAFYATLGHGVGGILWGWLYDQFSFSLVLQLGILTNIFVILLTKLFKANSPTSFPILTHNTVTELSDKDLPPKILPSDLPSNNSPHASIV